MCVCVSLGFVCVCVCVIRMYTHRYYRINQSRALRFRGAGKWRVARAKTASAER